MKPRLRVLAEQTQTDNTRIHRLLALTESIADYSQTTYRQLAEMQTIQFSVEFNLRDLMKDPEMKKALQEREQVYQGQMTWLDADLKRRIQEDEEEKRLYEDNLAWLDEDLNEKLDQRHKENLAWLDEDLNEKLDQRHKENLAWLDEDLKNKIREQEAWVTLTGIFGSNEEVESPSSKMTQAHGQRTLKIWHCGHGAKWGRLDSKLEKEKMMKRHDEGIREGTCFIHTAHLNDESLRTRGNNTTKQFKKFRDSSQEGDIVFTSCAKKGGLTHYGFFTGEITQYVVQDEEDKLNNRTSMHNFIHVYEWFPLSEILKGAGCNTTLYEVKPTFKNYQNYSIPS